MLELSAAVETGTTAQKPWTKNWTIAADSQVIDAAQWFIEQSIESKERSRRSTTSDTATVLLSERSGFAERRENTRIRKVRAELQIVSEIFESQNR